jgi:hypothetical protein
MALAATGALLAGGLAASGAATAASAATRTCVLVPTQKLAPHLIAPCDGATLKRGVDITFKAFDDNPRSQFHAPFILLDTSRRVRKGRLQNQTNGAGILAQMTPLKGHRNTWVEVAQHATYPAWWDNHAGTYYVQIQQVDSRAPGGIYVSPIVTVKVA